MVQSVGYDPFLTSFASVDQRRPSEREPDSRKITPTTDNEAAAPDKRKSDPSDVQAAVPELNNNAYSAKYGPEPDRLPLQLISDDQIRQAERNDTQAITENRIQREESRVALLLAQEARDAAREIDQREQEAIAERRNEAEEAEASTERRREAEVVVDRRREAAAIEQEKRPSEILQVEDLPQPAGTFLDLQA